MRKKIIMLLILISIVFIFGVIIFWIIPVVQISTPKNNSIETLLITSTSPDGKYTVKAYKTEPNATVDFSIKVYLIKENEKIIIYDAYHEYEAIISWINNDKVSINGRELDLSKGETFNWRKY